MQLTPNFTLEEFTASDTAARLGIDNTPPADVEWEIRQTAGRMEIVRRILDGNRVFVTSGFRCEALERVICAKSYAAWCRRYGHAIDEASWAVYFAKKQHPKGRAVDFTCPRFGAPIDVCRRLEGHAAELELDQLIHEFRSWTHAGWAVAPRRQLLTIDERGVQLGLVA